METFEQPASTVPDATAPSVLAIDLGRTGCRATLWLRGPAGPAATAAGDGSVGLSARDGPRVAESAILAVALPLLQAHHAGAVDAVGVGAPGAMEGIPLARELAERLTTSLPARAVAVMSDAISSHAGALAGQPGVVLAAGTGAVTVAIGAGSRFRRVDGWGPWIGDEGSGAWLGRRGLEAAARAADGRGPATTLSAAVERQFGSIERLAMELGAEPNPARRIAALAPAVAAAARDGDEVALQLMRSAAAALATSMVAATRALDLPGPVAAAIIGGLTRMGPVLLDPLRTALDRSGVGLALQAAQGTSIDGARRLALADDDIHEPWVVRARRDAGGASMRRTS